MGTLTPDCPTRPPSAPSACLPLRPHRCFVTATAPVPSCVSPPRGITQVSVESVFHNGSPEASNTAVGSIHSRRWCSRLGHAPVYGSDSNNRQCREMTETDRERLPVIRSYYDEYDSCYSYYRIRILGLFGFCCRVFSFAFSRDRL